MEKITTYKGRGWILVLMATGIALIILLGFLVPPANADVLVFGSSPDYSAVVLPNNSYVAQGQNISQGNYYDLRGVYGWSGELAHWNNDNSVGEGIPDQIVKLSGRYSTFISPETFPVGRWWQWDGKYCSSDTGYCTTGFGHGNAYVFYVNPEPQASIQERTIVQTANITINQDGGVVQIPVTYTQVETYYGTPIPTEPPQGSGTIMVTVSPTPVPTIAGPINPDVQDRNGVSIPGGISGAAVVTQKSPVPVVVPMFAVIVMLLVVRRRK